MNVILRATLGVLLVTLVGTGVFGQNAVDWGGSLSTTNTVQSVPEGSDDDTFVNNERLVMYFTAPIGKRRQFVSQAAATFNSEAVFAADVEKLYLQSTIDFTSPHERREIEQRESLLELGTRFGRFSLSEPTGLVLRNPVDGVDLTINGVGSRVDIGLGYAGFVNKEFSRVSMSLQDSADAEDTDIYFGPARLLGRGSVAFPNLIGSQNVTLAFAFQQDLRDPDSVIQDGTSPAATEEVGGLIDTQYAIAQIDGPVPGVSSLFYRAGYVFNTGRTLGLLPDDSVDAGESYQYQPIRAHMVRGRLDYFLPNFFSSSARAGVVYSTGDDDYQSFIEGNSAGDATMFTAATPVGQGAVFGLEPGNSTVTEVSFSVRPFSGSRGVLETLLTRVVLYNYLRSVAGPVSVAEIDAGTDDAYLGSELDVDIRWRPVSDVGIGLTTGFLFANDEVLVDGSNSFDYVVRLNASLSF